MGIEVRIEYRREDERAPSAIVRPVEGTDTTDGLSERSCRGVLESLLQVLVELEQERGRGDIHGFAFSVHAMDDHAVDVSMASEHDFTEQAMRFESLHPLLLDFVNATAHGPHDSRMWADSETPVGTSAMNALVMGDRSHLGAYIEFLRSCDLDHEVDQYGDLDAIIERHGWHHDTCALAAARLVSCHGQHGGEQVGQWMESGLEDYLATPEGRSAFITVAMHEFDSWSSPVILGPLSGNREHYTAEVDEWLGYFEPLLDEAGIERVREHAHSRWDRAHSG